jgi:hypothetical protein
MTPPVSNQPDDRDCDNGSERRVEENASAPKACADADAEMRANYPHLRQAVYSLLREKFSQELPPLPDKELEALAKEEGALPLEAFIDELEHTPERP